MEKFKLLNLPFFYEHVEIVKLPFICRVLTFTPEKSALMYFISSMTERP